MCNRCPSQQISLQPYRNGSLGAFDSSVPPQYLYAGGGALLIGAAGWIYMKDSPAFGGACGAAVGALLGYLLSQYTNPSPVSTTTTTVTPVKTTAPAASTPASAPATPKPVTAAPAPKPISTSSSSSSSTSASQSCPTNMVWDSTQGGCVVYGPPAPQDTTCPDGETWTDDNGCVATSGYGAVPSAYQNYRFTAKR